MPRDESFVAGNRIATHEEISKALALFVIAEKDPEAVPAEDLAVARDFLRPFLSLIHRDDRKRMRAVLKLPTDQAAIEREEDPDVLFQ